MSQTPTYAEIMDQVAKRIHIFEELDKCLNNHDTSNQEFLTLLNSLETAAEGAFAADALDFARADRAALSAVVSPNNVQNSLLPYLDEIMRLVDDEPTGDLEEKLQRHRDYMVAQTQSVNSPEHSYGSSSDVSGTGDGDIHRLTVDWDNLEYADELPEVLTFECIQDQNTGTSEHEEVFRVTGETAARDWIQETGSGIDATIACLSAGTTQSYVSNPSFSAFAVTAPTAGNDTALSAATDLTDWTIDTPANAGISVDQTYRGIPGETTAYSLVFTGDATITQVLKNTVNPNWRTDVPYYFQIAVYVPTAVSAGTVTLHVGGVSKTLTLTAATDDAWNIITIDIGQNSWYEGFQEADLDVKVVVASLGGGSVYVDDLIIGEFTRIGRTWFAGVGGATAFLKQKIFTFTTTYTRAVIQYWWGTRAGLGHLRVATGAGETVSDP